MNYRRFPIAVAAICVAVAALAACEPKPREPKAMASTPDAIVPAQAQAGRAA